MQDYLLQILIAIDQLANALLFGFADETLSSRAYRADQKDLIFGKIFRPCIDFIFFFQEEHCHQAYLEEIDKRQLPPDLFKKRL